MENLPPHSVMPALNKDIKGSSTLTIGFITVGVLSFFYAAYTGRIIGPASYADFGVGLSIYYVIALTNTPLRNLITHFTRKYSSEGRPYLASSLLKRVLLILLVCLFITGIIVAGTAKEISAFFSLSSGVYLVFLIFIMESFAILLNCFRGVLAGAEFYWAHNNNFLIEAVFRIIIGFSVLFFLPTALGGLLAYPAAALLAIVFCFYQLRTFPRPKDQPDYTEVWNYFKPLLFSSLFFSILYSLDALIAKIELSPDHAGQYMAATQIAKFMYSIAISFNTVVINLAAESKSSGKPVIRRLITLLIYFIVICGSITVIIRLLGNVVIRLTFGQAFLPAVDLLVPLCGGIILSGLGLMLCYFLLSYEVYKVYLVPLAGVFAEYFLITEFGISAVRIAWMYCLSQGLILAGMSLMWFWVWNSKTCLYSNHSSEY